jgi:hypothetical protein
VLEIVDQPISSLNDNLNLLCSYIRILEPNYNNNQIDLCNDNKHIFSITGRAAMISANNDILEFVISFKINMNGFVNQHVLRIEELACLDFIKIKIYN